MASFTLNGQSVDVPEELNNVPLLWFLREHKGLTGTKFGCGVTQCYACTVLIDGSAETSCRTKMARVIGKSVTTIEGLAKPDGTLHPVQEAWFDLGVAQCGYCQPGQILSCVSLLKSNPNPTDSDINDGMSSNLCRCGTYNDIRRAVKLAAQKLNGGGGNP